MMIDPKARRICVVGVLLGIGFAFLQQSSTFFTMTQQCITDAEFEAVVGPQIRKDPFTVDTHSLDDRQLCSGMTMTQAVLNLSLRYFPTSAAGANVSEGGAPRLDSVNEVASLTKFVTGTWESTVVGDEPDPGRCVSTANYYENSIASFRPDGKYAYFHQEGDSAGRWRAVDGQLEINLPGSKGLWRVRKLSDDHMILSSDEPYVSSERLRRCRWNADRALASQSNVTSTQDRESASAESDQEDPMAEQRCVWSCLANSRGATDPAYNQCVNTNCSGGGEEN